MSRGPAGTAKTRAAAAAAAAATTPATKKGAATGNQKTYAQHHQQRQYPHGGMPNKRQRHQLPSASSAATAAGVAVAGAPWVGGSADVSAESSDEEREAMTGARLRLRTGSGIPSDAAREEDDDDDDDDDDEEGGEEGDMDGLEEPPEYMQEETANGQKKRIPAFVRKLRAMLDAKDVTLIKWTSDGEAFRVVDSTSFSKQVLPNYFKHNNWQSFIRQLNIYGFMKLSEAAKLEGAPAASSTHSGAPQSDWSFRHPLFLRKHPRRMEEIKRRTPKEPKPGMMDGEHAWNMVKAARAASQTLSTSPSACPAPSAGAGKSTKRKSTHQNGGSTSGSTSSSGSNNDAGSSSLVASGSTKPKSFASSSSTSSSSSNLGSAGGSAASSASTSATTVEDSASAVGGDDGSDKDSSGLALVKPIANGAYDSGMLEEEEEEDVAEGLEDDQVVSTVLDSKQIAASLNEQVVAMQKQMNGMQKSMAQMAKAQARAIALTTGVLATQLAGMDSSVSSIQNLQSSLSQWQNACEAAISRSRHPGIGSMTLRIPKCRSSSKRKASNGHQGDASSSDEGLESEDDAAAEVSGTYANSSNIVGFGLSEPPPPLLQHGAPLPDPAAAAGFMAADGLQVGVPSQVPMFGYGYGSLSSLYGAPDDSEVEGPMATSGAPSLPDVLTYDGNADGEDQAYPAAKRRKR